MRKKNLESAIDGNIEAPTLYSKSVVGPKWARNAAAKTRQSPCSMENGTNPLNNVICHPKMPPFY